MKKCSKCYKQNTCSNLYQCDNNIYECIDEKECDLNNTSLQINLKDKSDFIIQEKRMKFINKKCLQCNSDLIDFNMSCEEMYYVPYEDKQGIFHYHDRNSHHCKMLCDNGHNIINTDAPECPSKCGFGTKLGTELHYFKKNNKIQMEKMMTVTKPLQALLDLV